MPTFWGFAHTVLTLLSAFLSRYVLGFTTSTLSMQVVFGFNLSGVASPSHIKKWGIALIIPMF